MYPSLPPLARLRPTRNLHPLSSETLHARHHRRRGSLSRSRWSRDDSVLLLTRHATIAVSAAVLAAHLLSMLSPAIRPGLRLASSLRPNVVLALSQAAPFSVEAASHVSNKTQVYISRSSDPFFNLSVEHCLLQVTPPDSTVLTLYTNSPSIVFGRNQNPWVEVNLAQLAEIRDRPAGIEWSDGAVKLVRRRSGGGAVFHDAGNVNFSVICPPAAFDRNKHAEMVVRALRKLGRPNTRVNGRHDIVMDVDEPSSAAQATSTFKISGSAYKLTRLRSLHHGTCLLRSPNLGNISGLLRSPAEGYIKALGVDSVRSPVRNVDVDNADFEAAVMEEFGDMYGDVHVREGFDEAALQVERIAKGYEELKSRSWIYGQTPRFSFNTHPTEEDPRLRPALPFNFDIQFKSKHGILEDCLIREPGLAAKAIDASFLKKKLLHDVSDWTSTLAEAGLSGGDAGNVGTWMNQIFGTEFTKS